MSFFDTIIGTARKIGTAVRPYMPTIAVVGGSVAVCGGAFLACRATLKVDKVMEEHRGMMEHINKSAEKLPKDSYTSKDMGRDKLQVYGATAGRLFRLYGPAVGLATAGFASIFWGFGMIKAWHAAAVSAVSAIDEKFAAYRNNVINEYGKEVDDKLYNGTVEKREIEEKITTDDGDEKVEKKEAVVLNPDIESDFVKIYSPMTIAPGKWEDHYLMAYRRLNDLEIWLTKQLQRGRYDHVFLNTVLRELGLPETGIGHFYGWVNQPGRNVVRFNPEPYITVFSGDNDSQIPMMVPLPVDYEEDGNFFFINPEDEQLWEDTYSNDPNSVGFILHFNVNTDENGVPKQIYDEVYGGKK